MSFRCHFLSVVVFFLISPFNKRLNIAKIIQKIHILIRFFQTKPDLLHRQCMCLANIHNGFNGPHGSRVSSRPVPSSSNVLFMQLVNCFVAPFNKRFIIAKKNRYSNHPKCNHQKHYLFKILSAFNFNIFTKWTTPNLTPNLTLPSTYLSWCEFNHQKSNKKHPKKTMILQHISINILFIHLILLYPNHCHGFSIPSAPHQVTAL